jgi:hypothetical protein
MHIRLLHNGALELLLQLVIVLIVLAFLPSFSRLDWLFLLALLLSSLDLLCPLDDLLQFLPVNISQLGVVLLV